MNNNFMKRGRNQRRRQGGGGGGGNGGNPNRALDSNGPDVRIRGTAQQIYDKYLTLARDATTSGDRVKAENYFQHAEHYFRVLRSTQGANPVSQFEQNYDGDDDAEQPGVGEQRDARDHRPQPAPLESDNRGETYSSGDDQPDTGPIRENGAADSRNGQRNDQRAANGSQNGPQNSPQNGDNDESRRRRRRPRRPREDGAPDASADTDVEPVGA
ncbi:MAG: DUF4167 domain-containing protein [Parvularculaceae bacterium]